MSRRVPPDTLRRQLRALALGALLGALVLGAGARLAMRGITLLEHRTPIWSVRGSLTVVAFGTAFGAVAATLRLAIDALLARRLPRRARTALFVVLCAALAVVGLTPLTAHRLALFLPVVAVFLATFELLRRDREQARAAPAATPRAEGSP